MFAEVTMDLSSRKAKKQEGNPVNRSEPREAESGHGPPVLHLEPEIPK
jgi:hypothetical protein